MKWISTQELAELLREFPGQPVEARPLHAGTDRDKPARTEPALDEATDDESPHTEPSYHGCVWRYSPNREGPAGPAADRGTEAPTETLTRETTGRKRSNSLEDSNEPAADRGTEAPTETLTRETTGRKRSNSLEDSNEPAADRGTEAPTETLTRETTGRKRSNSLEDSPDPVANRGTEAPTETLTRETTGWKRTNSLETSDSEPLPDPRPFERTVSLKESAGTTLDKTSKRSNFPGTSDSGPLPDQRPYERTANGTVERFTEEELRRAFPDEWWKVKPFFSLRGERERRLALRLVEELTTLGLLDEVIGRYGIEDVRLCAHCHQPMDEGWLLDEATPYCSDECLLADHPDIDLATADDCSEKDDDCSEADDRSETDDCSETEAADDCSEADDCSDADDCSSDDDCSSADDRSEATDDCSLYWTAWEG